MFILKVYGHSKCYFKVENTFGRLEFCDDKNDLLTEFLSQLGGEKLDPQLFKWYLRVSKYKEIGLNWKNERIQKKMGTNNYQNEAVDTWRKHNVGFVRLKANGTQENNVYTT